MARAPSQRSSRLRVERGVALEGPRAVIEAIAASGAVGPLVLGRPRAAHARRLYYDTQRGSLAEAGFTLVVSARGDRFLQSLKEHRDPLAAGFFERAVSETWLATPDPDLSRIAHRALAARARELCAESALTAQLEEEATVTTCRISFEGATLGARLEVGEARGAAGSMPIARLSLTLQRGAPAALFRAGLALVEKHPELRTAREEAPHAIARSKGERPLPVPLQPIELAKDASLGELIDVVLGECLRGVARNEPAARAPEEAEGVHQMRVAVRRLRSALRLLRDELQRERADALRTALASLADALGAVRDLDVFLERIAACEALGAPSLAALRARATSERADAFAALLRLLDSPERTQLDLELGLIAFGRDWRDAAPEGHAASKAAEAATALAARADRRARRAGAGFAELTAAQRHRLRLRVKAARYATELLAPVLPAKRARRYARCAGVLQDALGVECDVARARTLTERLGGADAGPGVGFLVGYGEGQAEQVRWERDRAWRRFRRARRPWD